MPSALMELDHKMAGGDKHSISFYLNCEFDMFLDRMCYWKISSPYLLGFTENDLQDA